MLSVAALGGLGEIGLNSMMFEHQGQRLLVDCGLMFPHGDLPGVEIILPDLTLLHREPERLCGVVLTHAHEDHLGALPALLRRTPVPVYGTPFTLAVARHRLQEAGIDAELRQLCAGQLETIGPFQVEAIRVTHSVIDAIGLVISAGGVTVVHSGDFKLDPSPIDGKPTDLARLSEIGERGVDLLLSDSTNSHVEGSTPSESEVRATFARLFAQCPGRLIVSLFGSHLHRVQHTLSLAHALNRRVLLWGRSLERNVKLARDLKQLHIPEGLLVDYDTFLTLAPRSAMLICTGAQAEPRSTLMNMVSEDNFKLKVMAGDTVVLSSRTIPGNEPHVTDLIDRIYARGATPIWPGVERLVHVSGHAANDEQRKLIETVQPKAFVPVHGELHHLHRHLELAQKTGIHPTATRLLTDGDLLGVNAEGLTNLGRIPVGRQWGRRDFEAPISPEAVAERRKMEDGVLFVSIALMAGTGRIMAGPRLLGRGLAGDEEAILPLAEEAAKNELLEVSEVLRGDDALVIDRLLSGVRRVFKQLAGRKPHIIAQVLRV
jgi:ribonuclease J